MFTVLEFRFENLCLTFDVFFGLFVLRAEKLDRWRLRWSFDTKPFEFRCCNSLIAAVLELA
jgi:hypothetical protein